MLPAARKRRSLRAAASVIAPSCVGSRIAPGTKPESASRSTTKNEMDNAATPAWPARNGAVVEQLIARLSGLGAELLALSASQAARIAELSPSQQESAVNLIHYLALRRHDLRPLQEQLASLGLSSLGRAESNVLGNLDAVLGILLHLAGRDAGREPLGGKAFDYQAGRRLLDMHTQQLLGAEPQQRSVRIMVTAPTEAAHDYSLMKAMLAGGMDCLRINCAHDDRPLWDAMVTKLRQAQRELAKPCRILMDLAGPKLRTGAIEAGPQVLKVRPRRNELGRVLAPARLWLRPAGDEAKPPAPADACVSLPADWLERTQEGDVIELVDARGAARALIIASVVGPSRWAELSQTAYLLPETQLRRKADASGKPSERPRTVPVGELEAISQAIHLGRGDSLVLTRSPAPGHPARYDERGKLVEPAAIPCTLPDVFADVHPGERILFDDGKVGGVIRAVSSGELRVEVTETREGGEKLLPDKGINLPDSKMHSPGLTEKDIEDLAFVAGRADLVGLSFVRRDSDIRALQDQLRKLGAGHLGIVLKIETRGAFEHLPDLVLTAMSSPCVGVMIARGDLAVECGFERLAEVQEEILWLCEAAHMPVIWATQVLETLAKKGVRSRAEITDAAMGERAECVMLNKGPHILEAIRTLDDILRRMQAHQSKKRSMLRKLHWLDGPGLSAGAAPASATDKPQPVIR